MAEKKKKLNKGLDAIFGGDITSLIDDIEHNTPESSQEKIKLDEIRPNPYQPRKVFDEQALNELALSIQEHGIFQPVILKKSVQGYEIVAGERRCRAARMAHLEEVPAIIVDFSDQQMMEIALLENIQREDLNAIEEAQAYQTMMEKLKLTQNELAKRIGKSRTHITNTLRLLNLPEKIQEYVLDGSLSMGHARALITLDKERALKIAKRVIDEKLSVRDVENIVNIEKPDGAVVQFGGQTAIKLTEALMKMGVPILGTKAEDVDAAEDRELFDEILEKCSIPRPTGGTVFTAEEAKEVANRLGYPVLVRPSYVLGGQGMQIATCDEEVEEFMEIINRIAQDHPILVDKYLQGTEVEVDAICDGTDILIPGVMEHIERAGVHSGDSISVYPAYSLSKEIIDTIEDYTEKLARSLHVKGMINIQFIVCDGKVYVIEVNPRSSRTVPYISKVTGIPIVKLATKCIIGHTIKEMGYKPGLQPNADYIAIKMPVFSFEKIRGAETSLGPEMKSTGECLGIAKTFNEALYKAFLGAGVVLPKHKKIIISVKDADKQEVVPLAQRFEKLGYEVYATRSTADVLRQNGVDAIKVNKIHQEAPTVMDLLLEHKIDIVIDTPTQGRDKNRDGFLIRRTSIETGVNCFTSLDTVDALLTSLESNAKENLTLVDIATI